jgi:porin
MKTGFFLKLVFILIIMPLCVKAEDKKIHFDINYTTELQYNFKAKYNWVNLLSFELDKNVWKNGCFGLQTISTYKTSKERIINDLQVFSNIETANMWVNLFFAGYTHTFDSITLFGGIRNVNRDYLTSRYTTIFTNSSCGVYPTVSGNFPVPNYPSSAMCLHSEFRFPNKIKLKNSIYNGMGRQILQSSSFFSVNPARDGVLDVFELSYTPKSIYYGFYSVGGVLGIGNDDRIKNFSGQKYKNANYALWGNVEKSVFKVNKREVGFILQGSFAPESQNNCISYVGAGTILTGFVSSKKTDYLCLFINRAAYHGIAEIATEFTWQYAITSSITIQPVFDYILTGKERNVIALLRVCIEVN